MVGDYAISMRLTGIDLATGRIDIDLQASDLSWEISQRIGLITSGAAEELLAYIKQEFNKLNQ